MSHREFHKIAGGPTEMSSLLLEKFDYIFYTGSFNIAQIIHAAANKYLTPVTLELGGKRYPDSLIN
jgi:acyl-CoA reductase-like NAD-dependent aldehyde dehydrogenase